ncbi:MAG: hypothetical protein CMB41_07790 [Euryarchaeota archaeon]|nr:hypothetical protein [Euryarchaeota archaeon]
MEHLMQDGTCGSCSASKGGHGIMCNLQTRCDADRFHQVSEMGPDAVRTTRAALLATAGVKHEQAIDGAVIVQIMRMPIHIVLDCGDDFIDQQTWHERAISCKVPACGAVCSIER